MLTVNPKISKQPQPLNVEVMKLINGKLKKYNWELTKRYNYYSFILFDKKVDVEITAKTPTDLVKKIIKYFNK